MIKWLESLKNTVNKYMYDIRPDRLTSCQSERKSVVSRRPSVCSTIWSVVLAFVRDDCSPDCRTVDVACRHVWKLRLHFIFYYLMRHKSYGRRTTDVAACERALTPSALHLQYAHRLFLRACNDALLLAVGTLCRFWCEDNSVWCIGMDLEGNGRDFSQMIIIGKVVPVLY
jgi:hypothetical protein